MVFKTLVNIEDSSRNIRFNPWEIMLAHFHNVKVGVLIIKLFTNRHGGKYPEEEATGLSWSNGRALLDRANFSTWDKDDTKDSKSRRVNLHLFFNETKGYGDSLQRLLQDNIVAFQTKAQVWKSKLKTCPEPSKVGFIMHSSQNFQTSYLVNNVLEVIKDEKWIDIEICTQLDPAFHTENDRKSFYTSYNI